MDEPSPTPEPHKWVVARPVWPDRIAVSAWSERFAALALGQALALQLEFLDHVAQVRADPRAAQSLARRYVRRDQARRIELIAAYLARGATAQDDWAVALRVRNIVFVTWREGAPIEPLAPQRALRTHAEESLMRAAILVARRGAGRCGDPDCYGGTGVKLAAERYTGAKGQRLYQPAAGDICAACEGRQPNARSVVEAERLLFAAATEAVLGGESRARARRRREHDPRPTPGPSLA